MQEVIVSLVSQQKQLQTFLIRPLMLNDLKAPFFQHLVVLPLKNYDMRDPIDSGLTEYLLVLLFRPDRQAQGAMFLHLGRMGLLSDPYIPILA